MASGCEYIIKAPCPTSNTKSPLPLSKKSSLHLFQLLTIDIDTQQRPKMWYHEVSGKRKRKKKTATKAKCCVILCLPFKGGALR